MKNAPILGMLFLSIMPGLITAMEDRPLASSKVASLKALCENQMHQNSVLKVRGIAQEILPEDVIEELYKKDLLGSLEAHPADIFAYAQTHTVTPSMMERLTSTPKLVADTLRKCLSLPTIRPDNNVLITEALATCYQVLQARIDQHLSSPSRSHHLYAPSDHHPVPGTAIPLVKLCHPAFRVYNINDSFDLYTRQPTDATNSTHMLLLYKLYDLVQMILSYEERGLSQAPQEVRGNIWNLLTSIRSDFLQRDMHSTLIPQYCKLARAFTMTCMDREKLLNELLDPFVAQYVG